MSALRVGAKLPSSGMAPDGRQIGELAAVAEAAGFDGVWVSDHVVMPRQVSSRYPFSADGTMSWQPEAPWVDALIAMAAAAEATETVDVGVGVLIIPLRNPLVLAKQLASIDVFSGGRTVIGVGAGWLREEFEALRADFDNRGAILDEWMEILRAVWTGVPPAKASGHYPMPDGLLAYPTPNRPPPLLVGGMSTAALRRVGAAGDGWFALQHAHEIDPRKLEEGLAVIEAEAAKVGRGAPRRVAMRVPGATPKVAASLAALDDAGLTDIVVDVDWEGDGPARVVEELHAALA
ncbi:MAG TPA: TIGR03619 family F420-dependent LLM class oxidoreductase [Acidimicrobiia bacterium]|nr:TIGR03619 family F420-dependent LLM class oxidoreductase [Acidimicrobiia bacterium]